MDSTFTHLVAMRNTPWRVRSPRGRRGTPWRAPLQALVYNSKAARASLPDYPLLRGPWGINKYPGPEVSPTEKGASSTR